MQGSKKLNVITALELSLNSLYVVHIQHRNLEMTKLLIYFVKTGEFIEKSAFFYSPINYTEKIKHDSVASGKEWFTSEDEN